jgi:hypothetical protein
VVDGFTRAWAYVERTFIRSPKRSLRKYHVAFREVLLRSPSYTTGTFHSSAGRGHCSDRFAPLNTQNFGNIGSCRRKDFHGWRFSKIIKPVGCFSTQLEDSLVANRNDLPSDISRHLVESDPRAFGGLKLCGGGIGRLLSRSQRKVQDDDSQNSPSCCNSSNPI